MKTMCPYCRQSYEIDDEFNLQEGICDNCQKHFIIQAQELTIAPIIDITPSAVESLDEELFLLTEGQGKNALSVHPQYIVFYQKYTTPEERRSSISIASILSLQLCESEGGSGRLTLSYQENMEATSGKEGFRAVSTVYFRQDRQAANRARQIADYIQHHSPQCKVEYERIDEPEEPTIPVKLQNEKTEQAPMPTKQSVSSPDKPKSTESASMTEQSKSAKGKSFVQKSSSSMPKPLGHRQSENNEDKELIWFVIISVGIALLVSFFIAWISPFLSLAIIALLIYLILQKKVGEEARGWLCVVTGFLTLGMVVISIYLLISWIRTPSYTPSSKRVYHVDAPSSSNRTYYDDSSYSPSGRSYSQQDFNDAVDFVKKVRGKDLKEGLEQLRYGQ